MRLRDLEGRRVALWGAARETGAVLRAAKRLGVSLEAAVVDEGDGPEIFEGMPVNRAAGAVANLHDYDVVVKSPGISRYRPEVQALIDAGVTVTTATNLWFAEGLRSVAVTGTKGKSTTSSLVAHLLKELGFDVQLAGNIGQAPIDLLGIVHPELWVLELSSFQTAGLDRSPEVGVLTTLSPEHLDWHGSYERYANDKLNLFAHNPDMTTVVNMADAGASAVVDGLVNVIPTGVPAGVHIEDAMFFVGDEPLFPVDRLKLMGTHNLDLACTAIAAVGAVGVDVAEEAPRIAQALSSFESLPHRLSVVDQRSGVTYVDDGLATTPLATMAALDAFTGGPVTVLLGGHDRGIDYGPLAGFVADSANDITVVTMPTNGQRIAETLRSTASNVKLHEAASLVDAVQIAARVTPTGGVVLLSPAAASFGIFRDYIERSNAFVEAVRLLPDSVQHGDG